MQKLVSIYGQVPSGYGISWFDPVRRCSIAYPFGIHFVAWAVHWAWECTVCFRPSLLSRLMEARYAAGYEAGQRDSDDHWKLKVAREFERNAETQTT